MVSRSAARWASTRSLGYDRPTRTCGHPAVGAVSAGFVAALAWRLAERARNPLRIAPVIPFRVLRGLGLYWSRTQDRTEAFEGRDHDWEIVGRWFHIVLVLPLALVTVAGLFMRRSRVGRRSGTPDGEDSRTGR
jgi:hypothetical protein